MKNSLQSGKHQGKKLLPTIKAPPMPCINWYGSHWTISSTNTKTCIFTCRSAAPVALRHIFTKGWLLCDRYDLNSLPPPGGSLCRSPPPAPVSIAMFGGINYNLQSAGTDVRYLPIPMPGCIAKIAAPTWILFLICLIL